MSNFNPRAQVSNTSRTIIFEKFNPAKDDLYSMLSAETKIGEKQHDEIAGKLEVKNFREFVEKFDPVVYQTVSPDGVIKYFAEEKPGSTTVHICNHLFMDMVRQLIDEKANSGESNTKFDFKGFMDNMLSPKEEVRKIKQARKTMELATKKFLECKEQKRFEEAKENGKRCNEILGDAVGRYKDNPVALLPIVMDDIDAHIMQVGEPEKKLVEGDKSNEPPKLVRLEWDDKGDLKPVEMDMSALNENDPELSHEEKKSSKQFLLEAWEEAADSIDSCKKSEPIKNSFLSVYAGNTTVSKYDEMTVAELTEEKSRFEKI